MGMKKITRLNEGPLDFVRGAAGETGRKVAQSGVGRAVGDVVQAGKTASAVGNFQKAVAQFANLLAQRDELKAMIGQSSTEEPEQPQQQQRQEPTMDAPAQGGQQPAQRRAPQQSAAPEAFRTTQKPKGRMGQHGFEYTFNSFLQATHGERIDEGIWDFVKGAGAATFGKMRDKINKYGDQPSVLKDIYHAGKKASAAGNRKAIDAKLVALDQQTKDALKQLVAMAQQFGPQAQQIVQSTVAKLPKEQQQRVNDVLIRNLQTQ